MQNARDARLLDIAIAREGVDGSPPDYAELAAAREDVQMLNNVLFQRFGPRRDAQNDAQRTQGLLQERARRERYAARRAPPPPYMAERAVRVDDDRAPPAYRRGVFEGAALDEPPPYHDFGERREEAMEAGPAFRDGEYPRRFPLYMCERLSADNFRIFFFGEKRDSWDRDYGSMARFENSGARHVDGRPLSVCAQFLVWMGRDPNETDFIDIWQEGPNILTFFKAPPGGVRGLAPLVGAR